MLPRKDARVYLLGFHAVNYRGYPRVFEIGRSINNKQIILLWIEITYCTKEIKYLIELFRRKKMSFYIKNIEYGCVRMLNYYNCFIICNLI